MFLFPLVGRLLEAIAELLFYLFRDNLNVYAFYSTVIYEFLGGNPVFYFGKLLSEHGRAFAINFLVFSNARFCCLVFIP